MPNVYLGTLCFLPGLHAQNIGEPLTFKDSVKPNRIELAIGMVHLTPTNTSTAVGCKDSDHWPIS